MLVIDASVLVPVVLDDGEVGHRARARIRGESLVAPELVDLEVAAVIRRQRLRGEVSRQRADFAVGDLVDLPLARRSHRPLLNRCWELRDSVTVYDAAYVALAELLGCVLLTADGPLTRAPGIRCAVELFR